TMEAAFCVETLEDALARHGKPEIFNTDQGSQFTGAAFTSALASNGIAISMDGKGAWRDNVFVERLWRSVKYEEVYLRAYEVAGNRHFENAASVARFGPELTDDPLVARRLFIELPFIFHHESAAVGKHCYKVGIKTTTR